MKFLPTVPYLDVGMTWDEAPRAERVRLLERAGPPAVSWWIETETTRGLPSGVVPSLARVLRVR